MAPKELRGVSSRHASSGLNTDGVVFNFSTGGGYKVLDMVVLLLLSCFPLSYLLTCEDERGWAKDVGDPPVHGAGAVYFDFLWE